MSNQVLSWILFSVPWLALFFMKKEDIKRFLPVALLSSLTSVIIVDVGISLNWWKVDDSAYPLRSLSFIYGLNPVITMWLMKFFYKKFILFLVVDIGFNIGFTFVFLGIFLQRKGVFIYTGITPFFAFVVAMVQGLLLYVYQMFQEGIYVHKT